jgi:basic membrane protein A
MRKTKRFAALALTASLFVVAACGDDEEEGTTTTEAPAAATTEAPAADTTAPAADTTAAPAADTTAAGEEPAEAASVGLLFDVTGRGDKSFNDAAAAGLDQAVEEFGITASESTPTGDGDRADRLNLLVDDGNELVIGVGFLWGDAITAGAEANPETSFAIIDSVIDAPNVASLVFAENEGSFLVGVAAGLKSQTGKVGFIGGVENDLIRNFEVGFVAGVEAANPDAEVLVQYISQPPDFSGFNDPAKGKEIAAAMYADGADVVYSAAGGSGLGAFEAAKEAGEPGTVWAIGVDSDQYNLVSADLQPYILTSMLKKVDVAVYETIKAFNEGNFQAGVQVFNLESDGVGYSTSGGFVDDIAAQIDEFAAQIIAGEIEVPSATS